MYIYNIYIHIYIYTYMYMYMYIYIYMLYGQCLIVHSVLIHGGLEEDRRPAHRWTEASEGNSKGTIYPSPARTQIAGPYMLGPWGARVYTNTCRFRRNVSCLQIRLLRFQLQGPL